MFLFKSDFDIYQKLFKFIIILFVYLVSSTYISIVVESCVYLQIKVLLSFLSFKKETSSNFILSSTLQTLFNNIDLCITALRWQSGKGLGFWTRGPESNPDEDWDFSFWATLESI